MGVNLPSSSAVLFVTRFIACSINRYKRPPRLSQTTRSGLLSTKEQTIRLIAGSQAENGIQLPKFFL